MVVYNKNSNIPKICGIYLGLLLIFAAISGIYLGNYYRSEVEIEESSAIVSEDGNLVWMPENASAGVIFYPGGKVECEAYIPLMESFAERNISSVLVKMPFHLAVFDMDAATGIKQQYPQIEKWYLAGHSLGGAMAASYLAECEESYEGLILLASYSTADLSEMDLDVLSIYGSEDQVLSLANYEKNRDKLPADFKEVVIEGGCHAYFGAYGAQKGDGTPNITKEEQIEMTADAVMEMIENSY